MNSFAPFRLIAGALVLGGAVAVAVADGPPQSLRWTKRHLLTSPHENAAVADFNRDGHLDPWKLHAETDLTSMHPSCPFVVKDLNRDGRLDIIFGRGHAYGLYWREQLPPSADGTTRWQQHTIDEAWSQAHCLVLADLDGDGEEELIAGKCLWAHNGGDPGAGDPPAVYYYSWNRAAAKWTRHTIAAPGEGIAINRQFAVADLNQDGRPDIVAPSKRALWVLFNEGTK